MSLSKIRGIVGGWGKIISKLPQILVNSSTVRIKDWPIFASKVLTASRQANGGEKSISVSP